MTSVYIFSLFGILYSFFHINCFYLWRKMGSDMCLLFSRLFPKKVVSFWHLDICCQNLYFILFVRNRFLFLFFIFSLGCLLLFKNSFGSCWNVTFLVSFIYSWNFGAPVCLLLIHLAFTPDDQACNYSLYCFAGDSFLQEDVQVCLKKDNRKHIFFLKL